MLGLIKKLFSKKCGHPETQRMTLSFDAYTRTTVCLQCGLKQEKRLYKESRDILIFEPKVLDEDYLSKEDLQIYNDMALRGNLSFVETEPGKMYLVEDDHD